MELRLIVRFSEQSIEDLLDVWTSLRRAPSRVQGVSAIVGTLPFSLEPANLPRITDAYEVRLEVPIDRRDHLPQVFEIGGRIPRHVDHHVNTVDGELCLGSPLAVRLRLGRPTTLVRFVEQCVVPYLYAATWRSQGRPGWPFQELAHGVAGLLDDYAHVLRIGDAAGIGRALVALARRHRLANRMSCPCGCGRRLGRCEYRWQLSRLRSTASRGFFRRLSRDWSTRIAALPPPNTDAA